MALSEWQRIEELFQAALLLPAADRSVYLTRECEGNEELRHEVESLLEASESQPGFIEQPAVSLGLKVLSSRRRQLAAGQLIGHYKIVRPLGSGGMGEVYLAEDCTLERQVALKFLANGFGDDRWAKDQLMKEARAVARLEHPNICGVHGLEEIGQDNFIVMQYVEGDTLAAHLTRDPPDLDRALDFAEQIVSALAAAHLQGVIHRDIKPQNIVVTPEGRIKVLDFGLAKFVQRARAVSKPGTGMDQTAQLGVLVGTVAYMSPEQISGAELDGRSDIFSFGIVLYQMLGGHNPFLRDSHEETLAAIKEQEPPSLPRTVPENLAGIVRRCLAKSVSDRFETTEDLLTAIRSLREKRRRSAVGYIRALRRHRHFSKYAAVAASLFIFMLAAAGFIYSKVSRVHTMAVLPIKNLSADSNLDYLSVGLTRNLYDKFSYLPRLKVRLPTEVPSNQTEDIVRAGRELKVDAVLIGEVLKQHESPLLRIRVLNTSDGTLRLEHTFSVDSANIFALQDEVTRSVIAALDLWLVGNERKLLTKRQTDNEEALRVYMRGRNALELKRTRENLQTAIQYFEQAIELDPSFAKAYSGLADCHVLLTTVQMGAVKTEEAMSKASWAARKAMEIDDSSPEAHTSMGVIKLKYDWQWTEAEREFKRAIEIDPDYAPAHYWYATLLILLRRSEESLKESEIGRDLDPYSASSDMNYGRALYFARRYDEASSYFQELLKERPDNPTFLYMLALVFLGQRQYDEAITTLERLRSLDPLFAAAPLGYAYGKVGRWEDASFILKDLDKRSEQRPIPPQEKAIVHIGMGQIDAAFPLMEKAYDDRFASFPYFTVEPLFDDVRSDPRFTDLARRVNLMP